MSTLATATGRDSTTVTWLRRGPSPELIGGRTRRDPWCGAPRVSSGSGELDGLAAAPAGHDEGHAGEQCRDGDEERQRPEPGEGQVALDRVAEATVIGRRCLLTSGEDRARRGVDLGARSPHGAAGQDLGTGE